MNSHKKLSIVRLSVSICGSTLHSVYFSVTIIFVQPIVYLQQCMNAVYYCGFTFLKFVLCCVYSTKIFSIKMNKYSILYCLYAHFYFHEHILINFFHSESQKVCNINQEKIYIMKQNEQHRKKNSFFLSHLVLRVVCIYLI